MNDFFDLDKTLTILEALQLVAVAIIAYLGQVIVKGLKAGAIKSGEVVGALGDWLLLGIQIRVETLRGKMPQKKPEPNTQSDVE